MDLENQLAKAVIDEAYKIHTKYGSGLLESAYEKILLSRLQKKGYKVVSQVPVSIDDEGVVIEIAFRLDILVEDTLIIELKAVEELPKVAFMQLKTYLVLSGKKLGLLINFGEASLKNGIKRIIV